MRRLGNEVELAELTHHLITRQQLGRSELTPRQIRYAVASRRLYPVIDDVFSILPGPFDFLTKAIALSLRYPEGYLAGPGAISYWGMRKGSPELLQYTVPEWARPRTAGFVQFRYSNDVSDVSLELDGLRVSSPARSVFDAASRLDQFGLESLIHSGLDRKLFVRADLEEIGSRLCGMGRPGSRMFRRLVKCLPEGPPSQSEEELMMINALRERGWDVAPQHPLVLPSRGRVYADAAILSAQVDLEVDGPEHDRDEFAVHRDKSRDGQVAVIGWQTVRVPAVDVRRKQRVLVAMVDRICETRRALFQRS